MRLTWHAYSYYPYERDLAEREIAALLGLSKMREFDNGVELHGVVDCNPVHRLTYFSGTLDEVGFMPTVQAQLEEAGRVGKKKQATRYSVHGLHEYKGKFNPQVARALLNIFGIEPGQRVFDPFCGSGTTLVECAHLGAIGLGADVNPLAVYIANAKLQALCTSSERLRKLFLHLHRAISGTNQCRPVRQQEQRRNYLESWFDLAVLEQIEFVRSTIENVAEEQAPIFLIIASNLLRDYSQQDPNDLRTRRRKTPLPNVPFATAFLDAVPPLLERIASAQAVLGKDLPKGEALLLDVKKIMPSQVGEPFDAAVTSPPYAMALPYIDTQRLSLVWLGLARPAELGQLQAELIGSREFRGKGRHELRAQLEANSDNLPSRQAEFCLELQCALSEQDGFRRQAVPALLYRYFSAMKASLAAVRKVMRPGAPYGLIVGHNRTTIGGLPRDIDTPSHLANLALAENWQIQELIPLQTYRRYGYHVSNAVAAETLVLLRNE